MIKTISVAFVSLLLLNCPKEKGVGQFSSSGQRGKGFWQEVKFIPDPSDTSGKKGIYKGWFHQDNIDITKLNSGQIRAKVEGEWRQFQLVELPEDFLTWNFSRRLAQLQRIRKIITEKIREMPEIAGPHNGIVASHGLKRNDADFSINNAVKGMGWLPKSERLDEITHLLQQTWNEPVERKLNVLESLYENGREVFDLTKQTSLELYSNPGFETHTFLNQMTDPGVAIVFLDLPKSYELRAIAQMLHPDDPNLTDYEKKVVEYVNLVHDYFHGSSPKRSIAVIYHIIQVFDNSPGIGRGQRVVPPVER
ncbi:MAG: hypothetical protein ABIK39_03410 [candidate division WOR-3 bacterium]